MSMGMDDSILATIKKLVGLDDDYNAFDTDIIVFINSAMMTLQQLGVGPTNGFRVTGQAEKWSDFLPEDNMLESVKSYIYFCVKMAFDPPANSYVMDAMKQMKEEQEWRLREQAEFFPGDGSTKGYWEAKDDESEDPEEKYRKKSQNNVHTQVFGGGPGEGSVFILDGEIRV